MKKRIKDMWEGLLVARWPLILAALALGAVLWFNRDAELSLALNLLLIAPAVVGEAFMISKLLWDTYAKRVGFRLPDDRYASLALFLGVLWTVAWVVG